MGKGLEDIRREKLEGAHPRGTVRGLRERASLLAKSGGHTSSELTETKTGESKNGNAGIFYIKKSTDL